MSPPDFRHPANNGTSNGTGKSDHLDPDLQILDEEIGRLLRATPTPTGLVDRVFQASVVYLRQSVPVVGRVGAESITVLRQRQWWSRAALAASLGLAFVIGTTLMNNASWNNENQIAGVPSEESIELAALDLLTVFDSDPRDIEDGVVSHLLETGDLSSIDDIRNELMESFNELDL